MNWEIRPLDGAGPLRFGMTREEVGKILDPTAPVISFFPAAQPGWFSENRALKIPTCGYESDRLNFVGTSAHVDNVSLDGTLIYTVAPRETLALLERLNGGAEVFRSIVIFRTLCVEASNFYDAKSSEFANVENDLLRDRALSLSSRFPQEEPRLPFAPISFL